MMNFCIIKINAVRLITHGTMLALLIVPVKNTFLVSVGKSTLRVLRC